MLKQIKAKNFRTTMTVFLIVIITFSGYCPFYNELYNRSIKSKKNNEPILSNDYDPTLDNFLYVEDVDQIYYEFNAKEECYILIYVEGIDFTSFELDGEVYDVSYGLNSFSKDFGIESSHIIELKTSDISTGSFKWICVEPLYIAQSTVIVDLDTITTDISFYAGGPISILLQPNFSYNWLYLEMDGKIVNKFYDTAIFPEIDSSIFSYFMEEGTYLRFDFDITPKEHSMKLKGNGSIEYIILVNLDWDQDLINDVEEVQKCMIENRFNPTEAVIWGFFEKSKDQLYIENREGKAIGYLNFFIPEVKDSMNFLYMDVYSGVISDIVLDDDFTTFERTIISTDYQSRPESRMLSKVSTGRHFIRYNYDVEIPIKVSFRINHEEILILEKSEFLDTDSDGVKDIDEVSQGLDPYDSDSDDDDLPDNMDPSPLNSLILKPHYLYQFALPHEPERDSMIEFTLKKPEVDYSTYATPRKWDNSLDVHIFLVMRVFGNKFITRSDLAHFWKGRSYKVQSYSLVEGYNELGVGDAIPNSKNPHSEYTFVYGQPSLDTIQFQLKFPKDHLAKEDNVIDLRFDFIWLVTKVDISSGSNEILHFYDVNEGLLLESMVTREFGKVNYISGTPDTMAENEMLWTISQNPTLLQDLNYDLSEDILYQGESGYLDLATQTLLDRGIGVYPSTHGFENNDLSSWNLIGEDGAFFDITDMQEGHARVLTINDINPSESVLFPRAEQTFENPRSVGTIEFWASVSDVRKNYSYVLLGDSRLSAGAIRIGGFDGEIQIYQRGFWIFGLWIPFPYWRTIGHMESNKWHHMRIDFNYHDDYLKIWVDGQSLTLIFPYHFSMVPNLEEPGLTKISFAVENQISIEKSFNIDALDYSWAPGYQVGRNKEPIYNSEEIGVDENEVLYVSGLEKCSDILYKVGLLNSNPNLEDDIFKLRDSDLYCSHYSIINLQGSEGNSFLEETGRGDYKTCYSLKWSDYSQETSTNYDQRLTLDGYPIDISCISFENSHILKTTLAVGRGLPVESFPDQDPLHDKIVLSNRIYIDKYDTNVDALPINFEYNRDIFKETLDDRDIEASKIIFLSDIGSLSDVFVNSLKSFEETSVDYFGTVKEAFKKFKFPKETMEELAEVHANLQDLFMGETKLNPFEKIQTLSDYVDHVNKIENDFTKIRVEFDLTDEEFGSQLIDSLDATRDLSEARSNIKSIKKEIRIEGIINLYIGIDSFVSGIEDIFLVLTYSEDIDFLKGFEIITRLAKGIANTVLGTVTVVYSGYLLFKGIKSNFKVALSDTMKSVMEKLGSIVKYIGYVLDVILAFTEICAIIEQFKGLPGLAMLKIMDTLILNIGLGIVLSVGLGIALESSWASFGISILVYLAFAIFIFPFIEGWYIDVATPSMEPIEEGAGLFLPDDDIKRHGGLEVGDQISYRIILQNTGGSLQRTYVRVKFGLGSSETDYQGSWKNPWSGSIASWDAFAYGYGPGSICDETLTLSIPEVTDSLTGFILLEIGAAQEFAWLWQRTDNLYGPENMPLDFNQPVLQRTIEDFFADTNEIAEYESFNSLKSKFQNAVMEFQWKDADELLTRMQLEDTDYEFHIPLNTNLGTDFKENIMEIDPSTGSSTNHFYLNLEGLDNPLVDFKIGAPEGFLITSTNFEGVTLNSHLELTMESVDPKPFAGTFYFTLEVYLQGTEDLIYTDQIPFRVPIVKNLQYTQSNAIFTKYNLKLNQYSTVYDIIKTVEVGDIINIKCQSIRTSQITLNLMLEGTEVKEYIVIPKGNLNFNEQFVQIFVDETVSFDQIVFTGEGEQNDFNLKEILIMDSKVKTPPEEFFNAINLVNNGNLPEIISFGFSGVPFDYVDTSLYPNEVSGEKLLFTLMPEDTRECFFNISEPIEAISNLYSRQILGYHPITEDVICSYIDNFKIEGIYIDSPKNMTYNKYGESSFMVNILPEEELVAVYYSLDNQEYMLLEGTNYISLPGQSGTHTIQFKGRNHEDDLLFSELRYFSIEYPLMSKNPRDLSSCDPMQGYFLASYGFENLDSGVTGQSIDFIDADYSTGGSKITVIDELDGHKKVLECQNTHKGIWSMFHEVTEDVTSGWVEFYWRTESNSHSPWIFSFLDDTNRFGAILYQNKLDDGRLWYWDKLGAHSLFFKPDINTWYHFRIFIDTVNDKWHIWINERLQGADLLFHSLFDIKNVKFIGMQGEDRYAFTVNYDAFGFSWDPDYGLGDNLKEGLILSYALKDANLHDIQYSIDDGELQPFSSEVLVPLPKDGQHSLKIYGISDLGELTPSEPIYFNVGRKLTIISPESIHYSEPMNGYFLATHGFENEDLMEWTNHGFEQEGIVHYKGHKNVLRLKNDDNIYANFFDPFPVQFLGLGTIEFWHYPDHTWLDYLIYILGGTVILHMIEIGGGILYVNGLGDYVWFFNDVHTPIKSGIANRWNHIKFDFGLGFITITINDELCLFTFTGNFVNNLAFSEFYSREVYVDAIGYSWDPYYNIGDNKKQGFLLTLETPSDLDLVSLFYSLDQQSHMPIGGNTIIPLPTPGYHSIQLFGNDAEGFTYESDPVTFSYLKEEFFTPVGTDVRIFDLTTSVEIIFEKIITSGYTKISRIVDIGIPLPSGFLGTEQYYDISTTAIYEDLIHVTIPYDVSKIRGEEENIHLFHYNQLEGDWIDITTYVDTTNDLIHGTFTGLSIFAILESDPTPPDVIVHYEDGDGTDGNPGIWKVSALDTESDINYNTINVFIDGEHKGSSFGNYLVPNSLGMHEIYVEVENNNIFDPLIGTGSHSVNIVDDDTRKPIIGLMYQGSGDDSNPGYIEWQIFDYDNDIGGDNDKGISEVSITLMYTSSNPSEDYTIQLQSTSAGTWYVPYNYLGTYTITVTAMDNDNDRDFTEDRSIAGISKVLEIIDDDVDSPSIINVLYESQIMDSTNTLSVNIDAFDAFSGISEVIVEFDGSSFIAIEIGDFYNVMIPTPIEMGEHSFTVTVWDNDNDRVDANGFNVDKLSTVENYAFEVIDDDTSEPEIYFDILEKSWDGEMIFLRFWVDATDEDSDIDIDSVDIQLGDYHATYLGIHEASFHPEHYDLFISATDTDNDRPDDSMTATFEQELDLKPPQTTILIGPPNIPIGDKTFLTRDALIQLLSDDYMAITWYRIWNETISDLKEYESPFTLGDFNLFDGEYTLDYYSIDLQGNSERTNSIILVLDDSAPSLEILNPHLEDALQDGVTLLFRATDLIGVVDVMFSIREPGVTDGIIIGPEFEQIHAVSIDNDLWEYAFDTTLLPDGYYIIFTEAFDLFFSAKESVQFSIRNWAVLELLPSTERNRAGRTMPVKFSLRVVEAVDPQKPFVWNEELSIVIYDENNPSVILQNSTFRDTSTDYRISSDSELYITNFKTSKTPTRYRVEIWRKDMLIGFFEFETYKSKNSIGSNLYIFAAINLVSVFGIPYLFLISRKKLIPIL